MREAKDLQGAVDVARGQARLPEMDLRDHRIERRRDRHQVDAGAFEQLQPRALVAQHLVVARQRGERLRELADLIVLKPGNRLSITPVSAPQWRRVLAALVELGAPADLGLPAPAA